jgi:hypothetical protein
VRDGANYVTPAQQAEVPDSEVGVRSTLCLHSVQEDCHKQCGILP